MKNSEYIIDLHPEDIFLGLLEKGQRNGRERNLVTFNWLTNLN